MVAPTEVSDDKMVQVQDVITSTLSERSDLLDALAANGARIAIYSNKEGTGGISQLSELWFLTVSPEIRLSADSSRASPKAAYLDPLYC